MSNDFKYAVGIMSGTSLDGIDVAVLKIFGNYRSTKYELIAFKTYEYDPKILQAIKDSIDIAKSNSMLLCDLNFKLGFEYAKAVKRICLESNIQLENIDFIASHGQTIYHINEDGKKFKKSTLQIGEASVIAQECNTKVISNFRGADIAVGGCGAPLVPYVDYILYSNDVENVSMHNLGGISNLTYLKSGGKLDDLIAFDTGPANMMIDTAMKILYNKNYDSGGEVASKGNLIDDLMEELLQHQFFNQEPPKSTGREEFGEHIVHDILKKYKKYNNEDIINTLTYFTAITIRDAYKRFVLINDNKLDRIIFSGGGAHNNYLINTISEMLSPIKVTTLDEIGENSSAKEAIAFAILGNETLNNNKSNVPSATGASKKVILGQITNV